jgi:hypothetical protein
MFEEARSIYDKICLKPFGEKCAQDFHLKLHGPVSAQIYFENFWKPNLIDILLLGNKFR